MIKLLSCSDRDMAMYYKETVLYDIERKQYVFVLDINCSAARVRDSSLNDYIINPTSLRVDLPTVQYDECGELIGIRCARSYKRGLVVSDIDLALSTLNSPHDTFTEQRGGRIGKVFFVRPAFGTLVIEYKGEPCGFFQEQQFYLRDSILAERLTELVGEYHVVVQ